MTDWESRMAEKAKKRALAAEEERIKAEEEAERIWLKENSKSIEEYVCSLKERLRPHAKDFQSYACACIGAPKELWHLESPPCNCQLVGMAIKELREE